VTDHEDPFGVPDPGLKGLSGKVAIVTGSTKGIGRGIAHRFAVEGVKTVVTGRDEAGGETVVSEIRDAGYEARFIRADLSERADIETLIEATVGEYGRIDFLVNNAAAWRHGTVRDRTEEDWEAVMYVSLRAPWLLGKLAVEHMPDGGSIVNISSVHSARTDPGRFPYNVAKTGLNGLTRVMAIDLGPFDVRVNGLLVGNVRKEYGSADPFDSSAYYARTAPANRRGVPQDVAGISLFLCTDESEFITGANFPVDGGRLACMTFPGFPEEE